MGRLADRGINILLFPEGRRSRDGRTQPFARGLGLMIRELSLPVVPVSISGMERVLPWGAAWPRRGRVTVGLGPPLLFGDESPAEIVAEAEAAMERLGGTDH